MTRPLTHSLTRLLVILIALILLTGPALAQTPPEDQPAPQTLTELEERIRQVVAESALPGATVSLVDTDGETWVGSFGLADVAAGTPVTPETHFRAGSISKTFVSLAVLQLVEQGRLSLDDRLSDLAPEVKFSNPWESTHPVRLVHLLEHTAGFDDLHVSGYALDVPSLTLQEGLASTERSRSVRWPPGMHSSYSNVGPAVAAYVVEKVSGQRFEDYVRQHIFEPLEMDSAAFFLTDENRPFMSKSYTAAGLTESPYISIIVRPSGAMSSTAADMAHFVQMLIQRGRYKDAQIVSPASVERMEVPASTLAARQGLQTGYGLGNYTSIQDGFVWHGHDGGVDGFIARLAYLPEAEVGYFVSLNLQDGQAADQIVTLIDAYLTRDLPAPVFPPPAQASPQELQAVAGYYEPLTPRNEFTRFLERIVEVARVDVQGEGLLVDYLTGGLSMQLVPAGEGLYRQPDEPAPVVAFIPDEAGGTYMQTTASLPISNFHSLPAWRAWGRVGSAVVVVALMVTILPVGLLWLLLWLVRPRHRPAHMNLRMLPLLSVVFLLLAFAVLSVGASDPSNLGGITIYTAIYTLMAVLFALTALAALVQALRSFRWEVGRVVRGYVLLVSLALVTAAVYMTAYGVLWIWMRM